MLRENIIGLLMISGVGAGVFMWPAGDVAGKVYPLSPTEAVQRLTAAPTDPAAPPFFGLEVVAASAGTDYVEFVTDDGVAVCRADIVPDNDGIMVDPSCGNPAFAHPELDGAAGDLTLDLQHSAFVEFIDAALERRPFNAQAVNATMIGSVFESLPDIQEEALENQRKMKQAAEDYEFYGGYSEDQGPPSEEEFYN
jgi:hypothetical protein